jgi:hypothetical protein
VATRIGIPRFFITNDGCINYAFQLEKSDNRCCEINVVHLYAVIQKGDNLTHQNKLDFDPNGVEKEDFYIMQMNLKYTINVIGWKRYWQNTDLI